MARSQLLSMRWGVALAVGCVGLTARAVEIPLSPTSVLRFAEVNEGIQAITRRDDYIKQMSAFDRQVRPKSDRPLSEDELLAFIASHVQPWSEPEIQKLTPLIEALVKRLAPWKLRLPEVVLLVKTSGREEGGAAYCRGPAIVLSQNMVDAREGILNKVLPHELFHIISSYNPTLREALYASIGFQACNEVQLPEALRDRKITNPDAPINNHFITVTEGGQNLELMPVLFSNTERYDVARGGSLFAYLDFKLMKLENDNGTRKPALVDGRPVMYEPAAVAGFNQQVGQNTKYLIHPEEILADNFVLLVNGETKLATPRVVQQMARLLSEQGAEG